MRSLAITYFHPRIAFLISIVTAWDNISPTKKVPNSALRLTILITQNIHVMHVNWHPSTIRKGFQQRALNNKQNLPWCGLWRDALCVYFQPWKEQHVLKQGKLLIKSGTMLWCMCSRRAQFHHKFSLHAWSPRGGRVNARKCSMLTAFLMISYKVWLSFALLLELRLSFQLSMLSFYC